jgi:type IV pilus biogenesis/stability protein PilW
MFSWPNIRGALVAAAVLVPTLSATGCISAARQEKAAGRVTLGAAYLREGNLAGAIETLEEGARLDKRNWAAWNKLGLAYMAAGAYEKSEDAFLKAIDLLPEEAETLTNYGSMLIRAGRLDEAVAVLEQAAQDLTYRKPAIPLSNLGYAHLQLGHTDRAITILNDAIRRAPNLCQARFVRGLAYSEANQPERALADFDVVIQLCGDEATGAYYQAGKLLLETDKRNEGCTYLLTAMQEAADSELGEQSRALHGTACR